MDLSVSARARLVRLAIVLMAATVGLALAPLAQAGAMRINTGGSAVTESGGTFSGDAYFSGGATASTTAAIAGTSEGALYQDERWGAWSYAIPVTNGTYDVRLHFVELYYTSGSCLGKRVFGVDITDTTGVDIPSLDICAQAGGANTALVKTISGVQVSDGALTVKAIYGSADDPEIAATELTPSGTAPPPPPPPTA